MTVLNRLPFNVCMNVIYGNRDKNRPGEPEMWIVDVLPQASKTLYFIMNQLVNKSQ